MEANEQNNAGLTPDNRNLMNGIETGTPFTSENQPSYEARVKGWAKRRALKNLLNVKAPGGLGLNNTDYAQLAADFLGIPREHITIEVIMHFRMMERAILKADPRAYEAVMDRAKGKPAQALTGANGTPLNPPEHRIVHVHSDVPLAESEDEVQI